jgi:hypothetical protein
MLRREFGNRRDIGVTISSLGLLAVRAGDYAHGRALLAEGHALYARTEDGPGPAGVALNLGCVELDHGDPERACALLAQSAAMWDEQHTPWVKSWVLMVFIEAVLSSGTRIPRTPLSPTCATHSSTWVRRTGSRVWPRSRQ